LDKKSLEGYVERPVETLCPGNGSLKRADEEIRKCTVKTPYVFLLT